MHGKFKTFILQHMSLYTHTHTVKKQLKNIKIILVLCVGMSKVYKCCQAIKLIEVEKSIAVNISSLWKGVIS